jgi:hypothetical protein
MPFPNFYVSSVNKKIVTVFERSRMSLSHSGGREHNFRYFHFWFMQQGFARRVCASPAVEFPARGRAKRNPQAHRSKATFRRLARSIEHEVDALVGNPCLGRGPELRLIARANSRGPIRGASRSAAGAG